jgi:hypothetical protein
VRPSNRLGRLGTGASIRPSLVRVRTPTENGRTRLGSNFLQGNLVVRLTLVRSIHTEFFHPIIADPMTYLTALAFIVAVAILITLIYAAVFARIRK